MYELAVCKRSDVTIANGRLYKLCVQFRNTTVIWAFFVLKIFALTSGTAICSAESFTN